VSYARLVAAIADLSDLVNRMTGGSSGTPETLFFAKNYSIAGTLDTWTIGVLYSLWRYDGVPGGGVAPGAVAIPTNATAGALPITNPGGGREKWLVQGVALADPSAVAAILLYDRLLHIGGLSGTVATAQTVGGTLTRGLGYVGNQIFVEMYTQVGATARTLSVNYTNQSGVTGRTGTCTVGGTATSLFNEANALTAVTLQAGDTGVQSVEDVTLSATTGTAGDFGITIARPIAWFPSGGGMPGRDFTLGPSGMPEIEIDACLAFAAMVISTIEVPIQGMLSMVEA
jgi:hypothetical protein